MTYMIKDYTSFVNENILPSATVGSLTDSVMLLISSCKDGSKYTVSDEIYVNEDSINNFIISYYKDGAVIDTRSIRLNTILRDFTMNIVSGITQGGNVDEDMNLTISKDIPDGKLRSVVAHEMTHYLQLGKAGKDSYFGGAQYNELFDNVAKYYVKQKRISPRDIPSSIEDAVTVESKVLVLLYLLYVTCDSEVHARVQQYKEEHSDGRHGTIDEIYRELTGSEFSLYDWKEILDSDTDGIIGRELSSIPENVYGSDKRLRRIMNASAIRAVLGVQSDKFRNKIHKLL